ncbi:MAG: hypothetical protein LC778_10225 [Acidobacteria bacterium]|nr:hypothetical protein [Acidobacteriota bacterium]
MQYSDNTELAQYLRLPHSILINELKIDWDGTGFDGPYSDISSIFDDLQLERSLRGNIPSNLQVVEGYSTAQLTFTLFGKQTPTTELDIGQILSPWRDDSPLFGNSLIDAGVRYRILVPLSNSVVTIAQFLGVIRSVDPQYDGTVKITALDLIDLTNYPLLIRTISVDYQYLLFSALTTERQKFNLTWAIDQIFRQCGLFQSGRAILTTATVVGHFCVTLAGAWFPEAITSPNYVGIDSTLGPPDPLFVPGKYGYAANGTTAGYGQYRYTIDPRATWNKGETHQLGAWVYGPRAINTGTYTIPIAVAISGDLDAGGRCQFELRFSTTGVVSANLVHFTGQSYDVTFTGPTISALGWHYIGVGLLWRTSDSGVTATFYVDGVTTTVVNTTVLNAFTVYQNYCGVRVQSKMPTQDVQWWKTISGTLTWSMDPPSLFGLQGQTKLDLALSYITLIPDIYLIAGATILQDILAAELGVILSRETGVIEFLNRETIRKAYTNANTIILDEDEIEDLNIHLRKDSFVNFMTYGSEQYILISAVVFNSSRAEQFDTPPYTLKRFSVPLANTYRVTSTNPPFVDPWTDGVTNGFHVTRVSDGTIPPGVSVRVEMQDQQNLTINVDNTSPDTVRLATSAGTPALRIPGYKTQPLSESSKTIYDAGSGGEFGYQPYNLPINDWRSHHESVTEVANSLLTEVSIPVPSIDPIEIPCDPRLQLNDCVVINTRRTGKIVCAVYGYTRNIQRGESPVDRLILRPLHAPRTWLLGEPGYTELGETTILS